MKPTWTQTRDEVTAIRQLADEINAANGVVIAADNFGGGGSLVDAGRRGFVARAEGQGNCQNDEQGHFHGARLVVTFYDPRAARRLLR